MNHESKPEAYRTNIRLSREMEQWVKTSATKNFRSFNGEIVEMIRKAMMEDASRDVEVK